ncbi:hypothetical protein quinque_001076 [Culex quinquefasciatus]
MNFTLCMIGCLVVVLGHVRADPEPVTPDTRKARHPVNGPSNYNSISVPDSETLSKLQNQVAPSVQQIPLKPIGLPTKSSDVGQAYSVTPGPLNSQYVPTTSNQNLNQYYMAMATPHATGNQVLAPAASPLIMQYINPQGQPTGGLQYIQLLRPVMYNPYGTQYVQPSYVQQPTVGINQPHQHHSHSLSHYSHAGAVAPPSPTSTPSAATTQSSFVPFQPSSLQQPVHQYGTVPSPSHHHLAAAAPAYTNPIGQYSSPMLSYFAAPPRISLINGPGELNTNEYMPNPGDHVFIKGVKTIRA